MGQVGYDEGKDTGMDLKFKELSGSRTTLDGELGPAEVKCGKQLSWAESVGFGDSRSLVLVSLI